MISTQTLVRRVYQLDILDIHLNMIELKNITVPSANGFMRYFYFTSDGSKHKDRDRHGLIMSRSNSEGIPYFEVVTTSDPMGTKDAEGLATLNVEATRKRWKINQSLLIRLNPTRRSKKNQKTNYRNHLISPYALFNTLQN